jgi:hypothetical protein
MDDRGNRHARPVRPEDNFSPDLSFRTSSSWRRQKIGDQGLTSEMELWWPKIQTIEQQRPSSGLLILGNIVQILLDWIHPLETIPAGWGARIRTWEWRNQNPLPYHLATPQYRRIGAVRLGRPPQHSDGACAKQCSARSGRYPRPPSAI